MLRPSSYLVEQISAGAKEDLLESVDGRGFHDLRVVGVGLVKDVRCCR